jgi:hypothetical protein
MNDSRLSVKESHMGRIIGSDEANEPNWTLIDKTVLHDDGGSHK